MKNKTNSRTPLLDIVVEIDQDPPPVALINPDFSTLPASLKALKDAKHEEFVKESPIIVGYIPKLVMESLERADMRLSLVGEVDIDLLGRHSGGVALSDPADPSSGGQVLDDSFHRIGVRWIIKFHKRVLKVN